MTAPTEVIADADAPDDAAPVSRRVDWALVPRVNLLPPEIIEERRFRRLQTVLAGCLFGTVVLAAAGVAWAQFGVTGAQDDLETVRAETARLQSEQTRYAEVPKRLAELESARTAREKAMGNDVLWFRFLTDLAVNTPDGTVLQSVSISLTGGASSDALAPNGLGTVKVTGKAGRFVDVASWLDDVAKVSGLAGVSLQSATRAESAAGNAPQIGWSGSAVVTSAALSHRYDRKAG